MIDEGHGWDDDGDDNNSYSSDVVPERRTYGGPPEQAPHTRCQEPKIPKNLPLTQKYCT